MVLNAMLEREICWSAEGEVVRIDRFPYDPIELNHSLGIRSQRLAYRCLRCSRCSC